MNFQFYSISFRGRRAENQDNYVTLNLPHSAHFFAVFDGMGGTKGGHIASELLQKICKSFLEEVFGAPKVKISLKEILEQLFKIAQSEISKAIQENSDLSGMGSTMTCVLSQGNSYVVGNIGDSRTYLLNAGVFQQITKDHTYIESYRQKNKDAPSAEMISNYSHYLTRSIDGGSDIPDIYPSEDEVFQLSPGDTFLLCSDGLILNKIHSSGMDFLNVLRGTPDLKTAAEHLVSLAYNEGSDDNITIVLAEYGKLPRLSEFIMPLGFPPPAQKSDPKNGRSRIFNKKVFIALAIILLISGYWIYTKRESIRNFIISTKTDRPGEVHKGAPKLSRLPERDFTDLTSSPDPPQVITEMLVGENSPVEWKFDYTNDKQFKGFIIEICNQDPILYPGSKIDTIKSNEMSFPYSKLDSMQVDKTFYVRVSARMGDKLLTSNPKQIQGPR